MVGTMRFFLRPGWLAGAGFCYGLALLAFGFVATGAGHGTYVILGLSSSPLGLTQNIPVALFAAPVLWCTIGVLLGRVTSRVGRGLFLATMLAHYAALPFILGPKSYFGDWANVAKLPRFVAAALAVYGAGQLGLWIVFAARQRDPAGPARFGARDLLLMLAFFVPLFLIPGALLLTYFHSLHEKEYDFAVEAPAYPGTVRLVKTYSVKDLPKYDKSGTFDYTDATCAIAPGGLVRWVRPRKLGGELCAWTPEADAVRREAIPEPSGFNPQYDFKNYFERPALWVGPQGDEFVRWQIDGNGDHGLAVRKGGAGPFTTARVGLVLDNSRAIPSPQGAWYLLAWSSAEDFRVAAYAVDNKLQLAPIGEHRSSGHHDIGVLDAALAADDRLHIVWGSVEPEIAPNVRSNWFRLRTIDLDVQKKAWSKERELGRLDRFVSSVSPAVHILENGSIHYLWTVDEGPTKTAASGLFCQSKETGRTIKLAEPAHGFKSVGVKNAVVVGYALESDPAKVSFRVIRAGKPGPATSITLARQPSHSLWGESMVLGGDEGRRFWFMDTLTPGTIYLLEVTDGE